MITYQVERQIQARSEKLWHLITDREDISWRRTITSVSIDGNSFSERHRKTGYVSVYKVIHQKEHQLLEVSIEHIDGRGKRQVTLQDLGNQGTRVTIKEEFHSSVKWLQPFIKRFFKKELQIYLEDLEHKVKEK